ncbi:alpha/beta hydrolase [Patescibacteria group bacterium]|nr:alpha/beta hydrolase [Patescibacteria group bacterium]
MIKKKILINGLMVNYYVSNVMMPTDTLVFLHGWGTDARSFAGVVEKRNNWLALDWPGFGGSDFPDMAWGVLDYAKFLAEFLQKLNVVDPILVGHSFGGRVIIKYCANNLGGVKKIILVDSAGIKEEGKRLELLEKLSKTSQPLRRVPGLGSLIDRMGSKFRSDDYKLAGKNKGTFKKVIGEDLQPDMMKVKVPAIIIWGENDEQTPLEDGKRINKLIKDSKIFVIKDAGHYPFIDQYDEFIQIFDGEINAD